MVCVGWPDGHKGSVKGPEMDRRHFLAIVVIGVCCGACVNIDKPAAVAACAVARNCSDNINNDSATSSGKDAAAPDGNSLDSPDAVAPSDLDASRSDQSPGLADAAQDATSTEPGTEIGPEASFVPGPEPQQGMEARAEPGPEPGMGPGGNAKTIGPCTVANGLAVGWTGVGVRGAGTQGEWDDVQITGITP
jgi:hypothetical protein